MLQNLQTAVQPAAGGLQLPPAKLEHKASKIILGFCGELVEALDLGLANRFLFGYELIEAGQ